MNKRILVLGASGGIGRAIVKNLAEDGWTVYAQYFTNKEAVLSLMTESSYEGEVIPVWADLNFSGSTDKLLEQAGAVDAFVHAGGDTFEGMLEETPDQKMDELWAIHLYEPVRIIKAILPSMRRKRTGSIVFISSIFGETGGSYEVMYSAVKGAQISFVKALGKELAPSNIRVNAVAPGAVETPMLSGYDSADREAIEMNIPLGRVGKPEEIAKAAMFLLGDESSYITSHVLSVNGGWYA
ncbi:elongation factor P 5-aminopentanone reductase [Jeotgalibacillus proteolyticus]|uniref:Short chain dehydrogenase n=1 Tax=Jeotgalibacillus proteolyticus TaxID=2082395 RepID=A0A2S5GGF7_9BACL|nr:SDR family oxidoreductase [Jeotgalibacillus proteolyticus]PPA72001.1 short chain dehydrogenase [Jeotgalibacillus proteolyticus]